jgi:hypothetical protein
MSGTSSVASSSTAISKGELTFRTINSRPIEVKHEMSSTEFSRVTSDDRHLAMLGYVDLYKKHAPGKVFYREELCGACGLIHDNPNVLDTYTNCSACYSVIREPSVLRKKYAEVDQEHPLEVLFASYGDPYEPRTAVIVTGYLQQIVQRNPNHDRLPIRPTDNMYKLFDLIEDPVPGKNKQLRLRYRINGIYATLMLDFTPNHIIPRPFLLMAPKNHYLRIFSATYGHPRGLTPTGRMSFDVSEIIQSIIDQNNGMYFTISSNQSLSRIFGDPCPGYLKDLRISFEIIGRGGTICYPEVRGHLKKKIYVLSSPIICPITFVISGTYGMTPSGRREYVAKINQQLGKIVAIEHRKREGLPVQAHEVALFKSKASLQELKQTLLNMEIKFIDISIKLQGMIDATGGVRLLMQKDSFDPNDVFGNPLPGLPKLLECHLDCQGHDSEKYTESTEMTETGYARNYIKLQRSRYAVVVKDDPITRKGKLEEDIHFETGYASPIIFVVRALYGELNDIHKTIDVTNEIQTLVNGRTLIIDRDLNLNEFFKMDPSPGRTKELKISYMTRGFMGNLRVREKNDLLVASIELGYPPLPPPDDENHVVH